MSPPHSGVTMVKRFDYRMSLIKNAAFFLNIVLVCKNRMFQSVRTKLELALNFLNKNNLIIIIILYFKELDLELGSWFY